LSRVRRDDVVVLVFVALLVVAWAIAIAIVRGC